MSAMFQQETACRPYPERPGYYPDFFISRYEGNIKIVGPGIIITEKYVTACGMDFLERSGIHAPPCKEKGESGTPVFL